MQPKTSLRFSVALVVGALSLIPNLIFALVLGQPFGRPLAEIVDLLLPLALWLVFVTVLSAAIGFLVSNILLSPLISLGDEVSGLASRGTRLAEMELKENENVPLEIQTLRTAFGNLISALRTEQQRRAAFMATLVHDLKTPIIAGNHVLDVIRRDERMGRDERIHLVASLKEENERLLNLVQRMVDAHRFEQNRLQLHLEATDAGQMMQLLVQRFTARSHERGIQLAVSGQAWVLASKPELERAVANLLENAIRYASSAVAIYVEPDGISIEDDGPGLPDSLEELAQPFHSQQLEIAGSSYMAGTGGLGLFIAQQIALGHDGCLKQIFAQPNTLKIFLKPAKELHAALVVG